MTVRDALKELMSENEGGDLCFDVDWFAPIVEKAFEKVAQAAAYEHNRTLTNPSFFNSADVAEFKAAGIAALTEGQI